MTATVPDLAARALRRLGVLAVDAAERPDTTALVPAAEIASRALQWIGVVAAGEASEPADQAAALAKVQAVNEAQVAAGNASWTADAIPLAVSEEMVMLTAAHLAPMFGKAVDREAVPSVEARVRRAAMLARAQADAEQAVHDVHAALDARGRARWSVFDIPDHAERHYVALAANILAPQFERQADQLAEARAERHFAQTTSLPSTGEPMAPAYF